VAFGGGARSRSIRAPHGFTLRSSTRRRPDPIWRRWPTASASSSHAPRRCTPVPRVQRGRRLAIGRRCRRPHWFFGMCGQGAAHQHRRVSAGLRSLQVLTASSRVHMSPRCVACPNPGGVGFARDAGRGKSRSATRSAVSRRRAVAAGGAPNSRRAITLDTLRSSVQASQ
jgi:hypothetical protein